ncbi:DNA-repair protein, UmuC-like domain-containing protein [Rozella allomycis CSF55]|uniref:DNA-repair protein, UmuC-like domain-containing protein n=1 Tax=Rozella allomycis (strain CSF55) TaxID=988480 RepID=A0A075B3B2_ROZAC|nr:DNA-repair protein, UmuC-like domain-containing protein [Rozella allomycis CSF55]|eukprot:EPZ37068.1 DNA-repair protein, UmuC-like domain-containing protein [Rozella allomycis CSF55]
MEATLSTPDSKSFNYAFHKAGLQSVDFTAIKKKIEEVSKQRQESWRQQVKQLEPKYHELLRNRELYIQLEREIDEYLDLIVQDADFSKTFVHIDMDAFYAAVEMRDNPALRDKPMAVGGMSMLSTANYEARKFGVSAAIPGYIAKKLCPELVIVELHFEKYRRVSEQIQKIFAV